MSVFYVHDASRGIITPLDRKFHTRSIEPTEQLSNIQASHQDFSSLVSDNLIPGQSRPPVSQKHQQASQAYQANDSSDEEHPKDNGLNLGVVEDIMSSPVLSATTAQNLNEAWKLMQRYEIHHLAITDEQQDYCGLISEKSILPHLMISHANGPENTKLSSFCQQSVLSTHPTTQVKDLAIVMLEYGLDGVAVTEQGKLKGIVTYSDILKVMLKQQSLHTQA